MDEITAVFGSDKSLYDVLTVSRTATAGEIKKAYFKTALRCHPDKCPGDEAAKGRFQALSLVHSVLSDPERRSLYDETGEIAEGDYANDENEVWYEYWRTLFPKITTSEIDAFGAKYKTVRRMELKEIIEIERACHKHQSARQHEITQGSEEEKRDVLDAYKKFDGKVRTIVDSVMLATEADEDRFRAIIDLAIENEQVPRLGSYRQGVNQALPSKPARKRKAKLDKEAIEAEKLMEAIKGRAENRKSATALSAHRASQFSSMVSSLEERYGSGTSTGASRSRKAKSAKGAHKSSPPDIDDAEFERLQQKITQGRLKR